MKRFLTNIICGLCLALAMTPLELYAAPATVNTSTAATATSGNSKKTFYDEINHRHWAAYYNGSAIEFGYTDDLEAGNWNTSGTLAYNTSEFALTYRTIGGVPYVIVAAAANAYDIVLRRGVVGATSIAFEAEVTALDGTADDDAYSAPSIALDGNNKLWVAAVWDKYLPTSKQGPDDKVVAVARSTNIVSGDLSAFAAANTLGKPDQQRSSVTILPKSADNMYLLSGQSSNNLEAWEYDGGAWVTRNTGGDMSWFGMEGNPIATAVYCITTDGTNIFVGGSFGIYKWDGNSWQPAASDSPAVNAIASSGGSIYAGGYFSSVGGNPNANRIARWDGSAWQALGNGLNNWVSAIAISGTDVYVGGVFTDAGGNTAADKIARWDGGSWQALGSGLNSTVNEIAISGTDIYVGGDFTNAGGNPSADYIARWDGTSWNALGSGLNGTVFAVAISGSDIYVGGNFINAGGNPAADKIARWDGSSWQALGSGLNGPVNSIKISGTNIYVGGNFTDAGAHPTGDKIARWDGSSWQVVGGGTNGSVTDILTLNGTVYIGGYFTNAGNNADAHYFALWDGTTMEAVGRGLNSSVNTIVSNGNEVIVGGSFTDAGGEPDADYIARWDGNKWTALGSGLNGSVSSIAIVGSDIYVGGGFNDAGGNSSADYIARWDGNSWQALGSGLDGQVFAMAVSNGNLYVGGEFMDAGGQPGTGGIARWDGTAWFAMANGVNYAPYTVAASGDDVYIGGYLWGAGVTPNTNYLAHWNGTAWQAMGAGPDDAPTAIAVQGGNIFVAGYFGSVDGIPNTTNIARWDGSSWHALGTGLNGSVYALANSETDVYAGGYFTDAGGNSNADHIARWDGTSWNAVNTGVDQSVSAILNTNNGTYIGGAFSFSGDGTRPLGHFAWYTPTPAADLDVSSNISASTDSSGDLHLLYSNDSDELVYRRYDDSSTSWQSSVTLASGAAIDSLGLSLSATEELQALWLSGNAIQHKDAVAPYNSGDWAAVADTLYNTGINTGLSVGSGEQWGHIPYFWTHGGGSPYDVMVDSLDFTLSITGTIDDGANPLVGVTVDAGIHGSTTTDGGGNYTISGIPHGQAYTLTPSITGYTFAGTASGTLTSAATHNFTADINTYTISGTVTADGNPLAAVVVNGGALGNQTTDINGSYSFTNVPHFTSYTLTPSITGYTFSPSSFSGTLIAATAINMAGTINTYNITGQIVVDGTPVAGVIIDGGALGTTVTDSSGSYAFNNVNHGTNYTLSASHEYYNFPSYVNGILTTSVSPTFTVTKNAYDVFGRITLENLSSTPLPGVTVSAGGKSAVSSASGDYTIRAVPLGKQQVTAILSGYQFNSGEAASVTIFNKNQVVNLSAKPVVANPAFAFWNGFLGMINVLEIMNTGNEELELNLLVYSNGGSGNNLNRSWTVPPMTQRDIILNDLEGFAPDTYGMVQLQGSHNSFDGRVTIYHPDSSGEMDSQYGFAFAEPLRNSNLGQSAAMFNSYHPGNTSSAPANTVYNWLTIGNLSSAAKSFTVKRYNISGEKVAEERISIPPFGRRDIDGGHINPGPDNVGTNIIIPDETASPYLSSIVRYAEGSNFNNYDYSFSLPATTGAIRTIYAPISISDVSENYVEVANMLDEETNVQLKFIDADGYTLATNNIAMPALSQRHFPTMGLLSGDSNTGYVAITPSTPNSVVAQSVFYYRDRTSRAMETAYASVAREAYGKKLYTTYNMFLGMDNMLRLMNLSTEQNDVTYTLNGLERSFTDTAKLDSSGSVEAKISSAARRDSYGLVTISTSVPGSVASELVRIRKLASGKTEFAISTPAK
ncbi:MAG: hypothetical protein PHC51_11140 [bacterium]|nr:hypothetical protein [bacterium]